MRLNPVRLYSMRLDPMRLTLWDLPDETYPMRLTRWDLDQWDLPNKTCPMRLTQWDLPNESYPMRLNPMRLECLMKIVMKHSSPFLSGYTGHSELKCQISLGNCSWGYSTLIWHFCILLTFLDAKEPKKIIKGQRRSERPNQRTDTGEFKFW